MSELGLVSEGLSVAAKLKRKFCRHLDSVFSTSCCGFCSSQGRLQWPNDSCSRLVFLGSVVTSVKYLHSASYEIC